VITETCSPWCSVHVYLPSNVAIATHHLANFIAHGSSDGAYSS